MKQKQYKAAGGGWKKGKSESVNESDVKKKVNRRGDVDGLLVKHNGKEYQIVYSSDFDMGSVVQPYGIVMPGDDVVSFLAKDKNAKSIWKQLKPKVDKFLKKVKDIKAFNTKTTNESTLHEMFQQMFNSYKDIYKDDLLTDLNKLK